MVVGHIGHIFPCSIRVLLVHISYSLVAQASREKRIAYQQAQGVGQPLSRGSIEESSRGVEKGLRGQRDGLVVHRGGWWGATGQSMSRIRNSPCFFFLVAESPTCRRASSSTYQQFIIVACAVRVKWASCDLICGLRGGPPQLNWIG